MAVNKGEIGIYGVLRRDGGDGILAKTDQIKDTQLNKTQEQLNQETVKHSEMGVVNGVATLDSNGVIPYNQLPAIADDEDLIEVNNRLKLKDKVYDPDNFSGKGYVILRKNIVEDNNILTQDMINKPNTIYEIRYDFDLNNAEITIPDGCVLKFEGGSINNGTLNGKFSIYGNLTFQNFNDNIEFIKSFSINTIVETLGYYERNDGGGAKYLIRRKIDGEQEDLGFTYFIDEFKVLELIYNDTPYNIKKHGIKYEDELYSETNAAILKSIIKHKYKKQQFWSPNKIYIPCGRVYFGEILLNWNEFNAIENVTPYCYLEGDGSMYNRDRFATSQVLTKGSFITWTSKYGCISVNNIYFTNTSEIGESICFGAASESDSIENNVILTNVYIQGFKYGFKAAGHSSSSIIKNSFFHSCVYGVKFEIDCNRFIADDVMFVSCAIGFYKCMGQNVQLTNMHCSVACSDLLYKELKKDGISKLCSIHGTGFELRGLYQEDYGGNTIDTCANFAFLWVEDKSIYGFNRTTTIDDYSLVYDDINSKKYKFLRFYTDTQLSRVLLTRCRNFNSYAIESGSIWKREAFEFFDDSGQVDSKEDAGIWRAGLILEDETTYICKFQYKNFFKTTILRTTDVFGYSFTGINLKAGFTPLKVKNKFVISWDYESYEDDRADYTMGGIDAINKSIDSIFYGYRYAVTDDKNSILYNFYNKDYILNFKIESVKAISLPDKELKIYLYDVKNCAITEICTITNDDILTDGTLYINRKFNYRPTGEASYILINDNQLGDILSKIKMSVLIMPIDTKIIINGGSIQN